MTVAVIGGDRRMSCVARTFEGLGYDCITAACENAKESVFDAIKASAVTVLPLPYQKGGILNAPTSNEKIYVESIFAAGGEKTIFIGGMLPPDLPRSEDYAKREDFLIKNAVLTAEGAIEIALRESDRSLFGASVTVFGFGRIGARIASLSSSFGAKVTVAARRPESRALAEVQGFCAVDIEKAKGLLSGADVIFNTVPSHILGRVELEALKASAVLIDVASEPFGMSEEDKAFCNARIITAPGRPGKTAFESAGKIIFETVIEIMRERGLAI